MTSESIAHTADSEPIRARGIIVNYFIDIIIQYANQKDIGSWKQNILLFHSLQI